MAELNPVAARKPKLLRGRRIALLASVAGFGVLAVLLGPEFQRPSEFGFGTPPAHAAEETLPHPAGFADIVAKVKPAVISVRVTITDAAQSSVTSDEGDDRLIPFAPGSPLQKFFQQFGELDGPHGVLPRRKGKMVGEGSGFFISPDGYAVTNNHVVDHATTVQVTTADGTLYKARIIGTDPKTDLALIKVDGRSDFPYVKFADHEPKVGDWVIAVGNPFGLGGTVTAGIVSAASRDIGAGPYDDYIQIDAPINKGNSGGPAFDVNGDVIGINTAIYSPSGGSVGIGFDIPASIAKRVVAELKAHGHVTRGWLGVQIQPVTAGIADGLGLKKPGGAIVDEVEPGSPAAKAGIHTGDVITAVNGMPVKDARDLARIIAMASPNSSVSLDIVRNGGPESISVMLAAMPSRQEANARGGVGAQHRGTPRLGLTVAPASSVAGSGEKGVVVVAVEPNGPGAAVGFQVGNVILDVNGKPVASGPDVATAMREAKTQGKHDVLMRVKTGNAMRFVAVPLGNA